MANKKDVVELTDKEQTGIGIFFIISFVAIFSMILSLIVGVHSLWFMISLLIYTFNSLSIVKYLDYEKDDFTAWSVFLLLVLAFPTALLAVIDRTIFYNLRNGRYQICSEKRRIKNNQKNITKSHNEVILKINRSIEEMDSLTKELSLQEKVYSDNSIENSESILASLGQQKKAIQQSRETLVEKKNLIYKGLDELNTRTIVVPIIDKAIDRSTRVQDVITEANNTIEAIKEYNVLTK